MHNIASTVILSKRLKSGETLRERLEAESRMDGVRDEQLKYPAMPPIFSPLIDTMNSLEDYSYQEIKAYGEMTGVKLDWFDINLLKEMDRVRNSASNGATIEQILEAY